jgi:hypothetical protein
MSNTNVPQCTFTFHVSCSLLSNHSHSFCCSAIIRYRAFDYDEEILAIVFVSLSNPSCRLCLTRGAIMFINDLINNLIQLLSNVLYELRV